MARALLTLFFVASLASCYGGRCFSDADCFGAICDGFAGCGAAPALCSDAQDACTEDQVCLDGECGGPTSCVAPCGGVACTASQVCENDACVLPPCASDADCATFGNVCNDDGRCASAGVCAAVRSPPPP